MLKPYSLARLHENTTFFHPLMHQKTLIRAGLDLIFPPRCTACNEYLSAGEKDEQLCSGCMAEIRWIDSPVCSRCGMIFKSQTGEDHLCGHCLLMPPPYRMARAVVLYGSVARDLLHQLKYRSNTTVVPAIHTIISRMDRSPFTDVDLVLPVPLHPCRLRQRGFNQSLILARLFFPDRDPSIHTSLLVRTRNTAPQTTLNGEKRRKNLHGAFRVTDPSALKGRSICLVDDVYTTGTTVTECANTLLRAGAGSILVLTLARAEKL